jgi:hypothetical protein
LKNQDSQGQLRRPSFHCCCAVGSAATPLFLLLFIIKPVAVDMLSSIQHLIAVAATLTPCRKRSRTPSNFSVTASPSYYSWSLLLILSHFFNHSSPPMFPPAKPSGLSGGSPQEQPVARPRILILDESVLLLHEDAEVLDNIDPWRQELESLSIVLPPPDACHQCAAYSASSMARSRNRRGGTQNEASTEAIHGVAPPLHRP